MAELPNQPSTPGAFLVALNIALVDGDHRHARRLQRDLWLAVRRYRHLCRRRGVQHADVEDVLQEIWLRLRTVAARLPSPLRSPEGYAATVAGSVATDHVRARCRAPRLLAGDAYARRLNAWNKEAATEDPTPPPDPDWMRATLGTYFEQYLGQGCAGRSGQQAHHLWAWYLLRIRRIRAREVARELGVADRAHGGQDTVHQWARRGADLVRELAGQDGDAQRREVMGRAAAA